MYIISGAWFDRSKPVWNPLLISDKLQISCRTESTDRCFLHSYTMVVMWSANFVFHYPETSNAVVYSGINIR